MANKRLCRCHHSRFVLLGHRTLGEPEVYELLDDSNVKGLKSDLSVSSAYISESCSCTESPRLPLHICSCLPVRSHGSPTCHLCITHDDDDDDDDLSSMDGRENERTSNLKPLIRSHSVSKLQCSKSIPFLKRLQHRARSHGDLSFPRHDQSSTFSCRSPDKYAFGASEPISRCQRTLSIFRRSWSVPSLRRIRRLRMKSRHSFNDGHSHEASNKARAPRGTVLMYVNGGNERRAVPIPYLSHPLFLDLLERAENEYGLSQKGALLLPCSLEELDQILRSIAASHHKHLGYSLRD